MVWSVQGRVRRATRSRSMVGAPSVRHRAIGGGDLGAGGGQLGIAARPDLGHGLGGERAGRGEIGLGLGQGHPPRLMRGEGAAEAVPFAAVCRRLGKGRACHGVAHGGDIGAGGIELGHDGFEGRSGRQDQRAGGQGGALEDEPPGAHRPLGEGRVDGVVGDARQPEIDGEAADAARARRGAAMGKDDRQPGAAGVDDPGLFAAEAPRPVLGLGAGGDGGEIRARAGFGQGGAGRHLAREEPRQVPRHQIGRGGAAQAQGDVVGVDERHRKAEILGGEQFAGARQRREAEPGTAVLRRDRHGQKADARGLGEQVRRGAFTHRPAGRARAHRTGGEGRHAVEERRRAGHLPRLAIRAARPVATPTMPRGMKIVASTSTRP